MYMMIYEREKFGRHQNELDIPSLWNWDKQLAIHYKNIQLRFIYCPMHGAFVHNILTSSSLSEGSLLVGYNYLPWQISVVEEPSCCHGNSGMFYFDIEGGHTAWVILSGCLQ